MLRFLLLASLLGLMAIGCDEDDPQPGEPAPGIFAVSMPEYLLCNDDSLYVFAVRVENQPGVTHIACTITPPAGMETYSFLMFDDGNASQLTDTSVASSTSLDVVPDNGTFTRGVSGNLLCQHGEGIYSFDFETHGAGTTLRISDVAVEVRTVQSCVFTEVNNVAALPGCFAPQELSVTVTQPEAIAIDTVRALWLSGDTLWWETHLERQSGDNWTYTLEPSLFACTPNGNYTLRYDAYTRFGLTCSSEQSGIAFENSLPVLSNPQIPDTMYRPVSASDSNVYQMFVNYDDCELAGWSETQTVWFQVRREDVSEWPPPLADFYLRNDGVPPDLVAGDNIASSYLVVTVIPGRLNDLYYFRFFAIDCASGDTSAFLLDSTRIIQSEAPLSVALPGAGDGLATGK